MKNTYLVLLTVMLLSSCQMATVDDGEHGVKFKRFKGGVDTLEVLKPGKYPIAHWDYLISYNTEENYFADELVVSREGVYEVEIKYKYSLKVRPEKVGLLQKYVGDGYKRIIDAYFHKQFYEHFKDLENGSISVTKQKEIEKSILLKVREELGHDYIEIKKLEFLEVNFS